MAISHTFGYFITIMVEVLEFSFRKKFMIGPSSTRSSEPANENNEE